MTLRTCVFPCAGFGTRFFPATKVIPKEMLPLVDKPILQYGIEEALGSGLDKLIIVTSKGKDAILDHFDRTSELERSLRESSRPASRDSLVRRREWQTLQGSPGARSPSTGSRCETVWTCPFHPPLLKSDRAATWNSRQLAHNSQRVIHRSGAGVQSIGAPEG